MRRTFPAMCLWIAQESLDIARIQWFDAVARDQARAIVKKRIALEMECDGYLPEEYRLIAGAIVERALDTLYGTRGRKDDMTIFGWTSPEEVKEIKAELVTARATLNTAIAAHVEEETRLSQEIAILKEQSQADQHTITSLQAKITTLGRQLDQNAERLARLDELERALASQQKERAGELPTTRPPQLRRSPHHPGSGLTPREGERS